MLIIYLANLTSMIISSSIHVAVNRDFILWAEYSPSMDGARLMFILSVDRWGVHMLVVGRWEEASGLHMWLLLMVFFGRTGRSGIARSSRSCTFPFLRTFSTSLHTGCEKFTFPCIHCTGFLLSRPPPSYILCSLFNDWCQEIPPCRFHLHFSKH